MRGASSGVRLGSRAMTRWGRFALALCLAGCCLDGLNPPPTATPIPPPALPGAGTGPLLPGGAAQALGTPISFGPGSTDPTFAQGFGGGPVQGSAIDPSCYAGHYPSAPSHVLTLTEPIAYMRVVAFSARGTDLTLLIRQPNGVVLCDDDFDGLNPGIEITAPTAGEYLVYVGNYSALGPEPYELGVSANTSVMPTSMHFAVPTIVSAGAAPAVGSLLLTGTATVTSMTGALTPTSVGSACTYTQTRILGAGGPGVLDCRWQLTCSGRDLYGGINPGGYQPCTNSAWSPGTYAMDSATTVTDRDPTFLFSGTTLTIGDDSTGANGAFTLTMVSTGQTPLFVP